MKKFKVHWAKTYVSSGDVIVEAKNKTEAEFKVNEEMGCYEGSTQYIPEENYISASEIKE